MKHLIMKRSIYGTATILLTLFLAACGGKGGNTSKQASNISISPTSATATAGGEPKTFFVTFSNMQNTGFSVLAVPVAGSPSDGLSCGKSGTYQVSCTPNAAGIYDVKVTADEDTSKTATARVTVAVAIIGGNEFVSANGTLKKTLTFSVHGSWSAAIGSAAGCSVSPESGGGGSAIEVTLTCAPYTTSDSRTITLKITPVPGGDGIAAVIQKRAPRSADFANVDHPDAARYTLLYGINNEGQSVGVFHDDDGRVRAFVRNANGGNTPIDISAGDEADEEAADTAAYAINDLGEILVQYGNDYFLRSASGANQKLSNYSGTYSGTYYENTDYTGINKHGLLTGYVTHIDAEGNSYSVGFTREGNNGTFSMIQHPAAAPAAVCASYEEVMECGTWITGVNNFGQMVGIYRGTDYRIHGFVKDGSSYIPVEHPYPDPDGFSVYAEGINDTGHIVGYFLDADGNVKGFAAGGGRFTEIMHPGAAIGKGTYVFGINNSDRLVGFFGNDDKTQGFLLSN